MKKTFIAAALCILVAIPVCAAEQDSGSGLGISVGARLSVLGVEPAVSLLLNHLEIEASAPIQAHHLYEETDLAVASGYAFGFAPAASVGYNSKPFGSGWQNGIGLTALWITNDYLSAFNLDGYGGTSTAYDGDPDFGQGAYLAGLYYRGAIQWKSGFSLYFRTVLPLAAYIPSLGDSGFYSVLESDIMSMAMSSVLFTASIGLKFTF